LAIVSEKARTADWRFQDEIDAVQATSGNRRCMMAINALKVPSIVQL
jgi:hypothetical protein